MICLTSSQHQERLTAAESWPTHRHPRVDLQQNSGHTIATAELITLPLTFTLVSHHQYFDAVGRETGRRVKNSCYNNSTPKKITFGNIA